jgi:hypothetical protein
VANWPDYEASLRQRGSLTVWFTEGSRPERQRHARPAAANPGIHHLAILTALTVRTVLRLAFHQTKRLIGSIIDLPLLCHLLPNTLKQLDFLARRSFF